MSPHSSAAAWLAGPAVLLVLLSVLCCAALICAAAGKLDSIATLTERAWGRLERHRKMPMLWGLCASVLVFAVCGLLFRTHILALLGVILLLVWGAMLGLGLVVAAGTLGGFLAAALGESMRPLAAIRLGLIVLLLASCLPYLGWILVLLALAAGTGAVLEALQARS